MSSPTDETHEIGLSLRARFLEQLRELNVNSKPEIDSLTTIAADGKDRFAVYIAEAIEEHILTASPPQQLIGLYVLDSISKFVGEPYVSLFEPKLLLLFSTAFLQNSSSDPRSYIKLVSTWPLVFSEHVLCDIRMFLDTALSPPTSDFGRLDRGGPQFASKSIFSRPSPYGLPPDRTPGHSEGLSHFVGPAYPQLGSSFPSAPQSFSPFISGIDSRKPSASGSLQISGSAHPFLSPLSSAATTGMLTSSSIARDSFSIPSRSLDSFLNFALNNPQVHHALQVAMADPRVSSLVTFHLSRASEESDSLLELVNLLGISSDIVESFIMMSNENVDSFEGKFSENGMLKNSRTGLPSDLRFVTPEKSIAHVSRLMVCTSNRKEKLLLAKSLSTSTPSSSSTTRKGPLSLFCRSFSPCREEWIRIRMNSDEDQTVHPVVPRGFLSDMQSSPSSPESPSESFALPADPTQDVCPICMELFDRFLDEEDGEFKYKGTVHRPSDGHIVHFSCLGSAERDEILMGIPTLPSS